MQEGSRIEALLNKCHCCCPPFILWVSDCVSLSSITDCVSFCQESKVNLDQILDGIKTLRELLSSQEMQLIKLEEQISKIAI